MAGSKVRRTIGGHTFVGDEETLRLLRRETSGHLQQLLTQARDHGHAIVTLNNERWAITRQSDHTFRLVLDNGHTHLML